MPSWNPALRPNSAKDIVAPEPDLAAKLAKEFEDEDDDFIFDDAGGATDILGSDDEGLLDDDDELLEDSAVVSTAAPTRSTSNPASSQAGTYVPLNGLQLQPDSNDRDPSYNHPSPSWHPQIPSTAGPTTSVPGSAPAARPNLQATESFVAKPKGGYHSPYDLPMEIVKPKKRASAQVSKIHSAGTVPPPPPSPAVGQPCATPSPPLPKPAAKHKGSFFEDLPLASRPRPTSRHSMATTPQSPSGPPTSLPRGIPSQLSHVPSPLSSPPEARYPASSGNMPLTRSSSYASSTGGSQSILSPPPPSTSARYSPGPSRTPSAVVPPPASSRYSPAPLGAKPSTPSIAAFPHQPRTSSPLAQSEVGADQIRGTPSATTDNIGQLRRASTGFAHSGNRGTPLPTTDELDEDTDALPQSQLNSTSTVGLTSPQKQRVPNQATQARYAPALLPPESHAQNGPIPSRDVVPPPRSQTQSPGVLFRKRNAAKSSDPIQRPSSVSGPRPSQKTSHYSHSGILPELQQEHGNFMAPRGRSLSKSFHLVPPTDGREYDPLQRWKGCPVLSWGIGGTIVTSFPQPIAQYGGVGATRPTMVMGPGYVKVKHVKDIGLLDEQIIKFPGPLKGKGKKKEVVAWLTGGIDNLEKENASRVMEASDSHHAKRSVERILLWKLLRVFIEHDGRLEGTETVEKAVRDALAGDGSETSNTTPIFGAAQDFRVLQSSTATSMQSDAVEPEAVERIRAALMKGDRETAVWAAVDKRLWGHAMLIARTMPADLFVKVAREFIRKEVNYLHHSNESLATLYGVFAGDHAECVDELVPVHARAGVQLMASDGSSNLKKDAMTGLDKWQETLAMILSNRSSGDAQALVSLGNLLSGYGRAEASHICYMFARSVAVFGGLDDPTASFVLLGADHHRLSDQFADTQALLLSEVFEYGLTLAGNVQSAPHLAAYKLQHALLLAEGGQRDKALQYCDTISQAISAHTKKSPYYHAALESAVEDLVKRLKHAPKEESSSWIMSGPSKSSMTDMFKQKFIEFVAGDDSADSATGAASEAVGLVPFRNMPSVDTPAISRTPSMSNFGAYNNHNLLNPPIAEPPSRGASRYTPAPPATTASGIPTATSYAPHPAPANSINNYAPPAPPFSSRTSSNHSRGTYDSNRGSAAADYSPAHTYGFASASSSYAPASGMDYARLATPLNHAMHDILPESQTGPNQAYASTAIEADASAGDDESNADQLNLGYQPPSLGLEPPSYQPYQPEEDNDEDAAKPKAKKKSYFDDDNDEGGEGYGNDENKGSVPKHQAQDKTEEEVDRENREMIRRAAEEDAKRAEEEKAKKKSGWGFGWFAGKKKEDAPAPIKAKLGEENSFVFDKELNRWVNKRSGADQAAASAAPPPPPKRASSGSKSPAPGQPPAGGRSSVPPPLARSFTATASNLGHQAALHNASNAPVSDKAPLMARSSSSMSMTSLPPRPGTSLSNASSIDDLIATAAPRRGTKKPKRGGRYVDVMAQK